MNIKVTVNNVSILEKDTLNENEFNIHTCNFTFSEEYNGLTKKAVFTGKDGKTYQQTIENNMCSIPSEVLIDRQNVEIGVYAYAVENEELLLRYSPEPTQFFINQGSYKEAQNSTPPTPSEIEQLQAQITNNKNNIEELTGDVVDINTEIATINDDITNIKAEQTEQNTNIQNNTDNITSINRYITEINQDIQDLETNKADKNEIPTKTSDLINDSDFVVDNNYVHTDNNFTNEDKDQIQTNKDDIVEINQTIDSINTDIAEINQDINEIKTEQTTQNTNISANANAITSLQSTKADKAEIPTKVSDLTNDSGFITKNVNDLINYTLKTNTGSLIDLEINSTTYVITLSLKNQDGTVISTDTIDLPLESVVVGGSYDAVNKKIVLTLENGNTVDIPVGDLIAGLQTEITSLNKLASDLVDDTNSGNKFVTTSEKQTWNNKLDESDLADYVKNTDYATSSKGGVVKSGWYGFLVDNEGHPTTAVYDYATYLNASNAPFIGKGTLENVIEGKGLVSNTDYGTASKGGTVKIDGYFDVALTNEGKMYALDRNYNYYTNTSPNSAFISKGTLEKVITGKELVNKTYVDDIVGDIESILEELDIGGGVV